MVSLLFLVSFHDFPPPVSSVPVISPSAFSTTHTITSRKPPRSLRKITPTRSYGELALNNVTFAYPSRPTIPVLSAVSLYLPANETTFIVGSSSSRKSTIAQLLLRMYEPQVGEVSLDEQDMRFLDEEWMQEQIAGVSQGGVVILDGKSVCDNVAASVWGTRGVPRAEVEDACRAALMHEFVRDLPDGYETVLGRGAGGVGLSGGQKQRLGIARARLRNPAVLILEEATSALDATSRILVFEAIKLWRLSSRDISSVVSLKLDHSASDSSLDEGREVGRLGFWALIRSVYPTIPHKPFVLLGLVGCCLSGAMTPIFSLLSRLLFEVAIGARNVSTINEIRWNSPQDRSHRRHPPRLQVLHHGVFVRGFTLSKVLARDKKYFDKPANAPTRVVQVLVKDGDDAHNLVSVVWQLTLVGFAVAPVFAATTMMVRTRLVARCKIRNKGAREEVAKVYYETISNIRGSGCMAFEGALITGVMGAFVEGCTYQLASGLIYLAEALLFSVTIGSTHGFHGENCKTCGTTNDLNNLIQLNISSTDESRGVLRSELARNITFNNVQFSYPETSEATILRNVNLIIEDGECVAIVGSSGSGKSTIASLLQRLYEPSSRSVAIGLNDLRGVEIKHLREHVSVVSQHPNLFFDATIRCVTE
ncbi:hypothetical protein K443DRAFT_13655 [Laccaria amethystina LaAM-08-1]|uniref:ABC transporter domain-containing protein n=1 Tax=Laccaria amethystina LaAM-08-1 TaxID=1095629 RepID=A0A0C9WUW6_9AGAR|nr:hypothetical protein K443DRAFT_13655 [Laccaria amethystina LaAM-08-1]